LGTGWLRRKGAVMSKWSTGTNEAGHRCRVRFAVAILIMLLTAVMSQGPALGASLAECPLRFAVIGDRTGDAVPGVYEQAVAEIERLKPEFVITVGDMIQGYTEDKAEMERQWTEYMEIIKAFSMPVYFTPGNHDITDTPMVEAYERWIGRPYYSFDVRGVHFIVLDTSRYQTAVALPAEQMDWLKRDLKEHKGSAYTFVFFHIPTWRQAVALGKPDPIHAVLAEYGVDAVFSGHYHQYFSGSYDGIAYTAVGSSGGGTEPGPTGLEYHFAWVTVDDQDFTIAPIKLGAVLPWDEVTVDQVIMISKIQGEAMKISAVSLGSDLTVPQTKITVTLRNLTGLPVKGPLTWAVPEGWSITPDKADVDLGARGDEAFDFTVASGAKVYPAPTVSVDYPFQKDKTFSVKRALPVVRTAYAHKAARAPKIDGEVDEAVWQGPVTDFFAPDGSPMTADPVAFYFAWDRDNLYLAATCHECMIDSMGPACTEHDCSVYTGECVGYFLEPVSADGPVYQIYFNTAGAVFDQKIDVESGVSTYYDPKWNGTYQVRTSRGADYWALEATVPLKQLGVQAKAGDRWNVNFRRKQKRLATSADWQVPIGYDPAGYGVLELK
jgi:predicted phosphodiesterase